MGGEIRWLGNSQVVIGKDGKEIHLTIGNPAAAIDGILHPLSAAPEIQKGRTMVPLRFISEGLNAQVLWEQKTKTISIFY